MTATPTLRGLAKVLQQAEELGFEIRMPTDIDPAAVTEAAYAGTPEVELRKRLMDGMADHADRIGELVQQLGPRRALPIIVDTAGRRPGQLYGLIGALAYRRLLPTDDTLFDTVTGLEPESARIVVDATLERAHTVSITPGALLGFARSNGAPASWVLRRVGKHGSLPDGPLARLVDLVADEIGEDLDAAVALATELRSIRWSLTDEQATNLLEHGDRVAALLTVVVLGRMVPDLRTATLARDGGLVLLLAHDVPLPTPALIEAATRPGALRHVSKAGAATVLETVPVPPELLVELIERSEGMFVFLVRSHGPNTPTAQTVMLAHDRGLIPGDLLVDRGQFEKVFDRDWFPDLFARTPGVAVPLVQALHKAGSGHLYEETLRGLAVMMSVAADELGEDTELWERFLAVTPGSSSPFANPSLTIADAVRVLTSRWDRARARIARKS